MRIWIKIHSPDKTNAKTNFTFLFVFFLLKPCFWVMNSIEPNPDSYATQNSEIHIPVANLLQHWPQVDVDPTARAQLLFQPGVQRFLFQSHWYLQGCGSAFILCGSGSSSFSECGSGSSWTKFEEKIMKSFFKLKKHKTLLKIKKQWSLLKFTLKKRN